MVTHCEPTMAEAGPADHGGQVARGVAASRRAPGCDVSLRTRAGAGGWLALPCHSSVLAALSPVLRAALAGAEGEEEAVLISELEGGPLLSLLYSGSAECASRAAAEELRAALAELGVGGAVTLARLHRPAPLVVRQQTVMHIVLGVSPEEQDDCGANVPEEVGVAAVPLLRASSALGGADPRPVKLRGPGPGLECEECGGRYTTETNLRSHMADQHTPVRCRECGVGVRGSRRLVEHQAAVHQAGGRPALQDSPTCSICHETFVTNQALKFHLYKHSGLKPFECKVCSASFRTPSTLKSHVEVQHTESKHRCEICGLKSSTSGKLKIHMRTHTNEKPFQCTFCPTRFRQLSVLRVHEFTHTKKSSHKCDRCGTFFPTKNRLIGHKSKPVCVSRARGPASHVRRPRPARPHRGAAGVLEGLGPAAMDQPVTYLIHSEAVAGLQEGQVGYGPPLAGYQADALGALGTDEIPVLVDTLPVIIQTDMEQGRELGGGAEEMAKHQEIMFGL